MKRFHMVFVSLLLLALVGCGSGTSAGKTLVSVNGEKITEGDLTFLSDVNPRIKAQMGNPAAQKQILNNLVDQSLLYQVAVKEGIPNKKEVKEKIELYRKVLVAQALIDDETEKSAEKYYTEHKDEFNKLGLSHIMVQYGNVDSKKAPEAPKKGKVADKKVVATHTETEALKMIEDIKARLNKGEAFEKLAEETSEDTASARQGGKLGKIGKGERQLEARGFGPIVEKAFELKVGEVSGPIKTQKGYHLVVVTSPAEQEPFDAVKDRLVFKVQAEAREGLLARLKKDAKIEWANAKGATEKASPSTEGGPAPSGQMPMNHPPMPPQHPTMPMKAPEAKPTK